MLIAICSFIPVLAAAETPAIYGEQKDTRVYEGDVDLNQIMGFQSTESLVTYLIDSYFTSYSASGSFYINTGMVRVSYGHVASTTGTVTAKLVNVNNGSESQPITISGTAGQSKTTTLSWSQVPTGNWRLVCTLSPTAPSSHERFVVIFMIPKV